MRSVKTAVAVIVPFVVLLATAQIESRLRAQDASRPLALVGGSLIDGTGAPPVRNSVVLVRGDRIERVGTVDSLQVPSGYDEISTEGMTVLPGLWDMHVHLVYSGHPNPGAWFRHAAQFERVTIPASAEQMLMAGVTSVRDLAAPPDAILAVKRRIASGELPGPTLYAAGPALTKLGPNQTTVTPQFLPVLDAADARAKTRQLIAAGVDVIKIFNAGRMSAEERAAIVAEARAAGRKIAAHGQTDDEIRLGLALGVDDFQHIGIDSPEYPPDIMDALRARVKTGPPVYWTPTVGANNLLNGELVVAKAEFLDDPAAYHGLPAPLVAEVKQAWASYEPRPPHPDTRAIVRRKIEQMRQAGVELVFGSDEGATGQLARHSTWMDADLWVRELGLDPMFVIRRMTLDAARAMGVDRDTGSVTAGKYADIIAVPGDPLRHINVLRDPAVVVKHGRRYR